MKKSFTPLLFGLLFAVSGAQAADTTTPIVDENSASFPAGLWNTVHYKVNTNGSRPVHISVCIKANGTWQSLDSTDGLGGSWTRTGNNVHLSGNGKNKSTAGTGDLNLINPYRFMTGTWQSWPLSEPTKHSSYTSEWTLAIAKRCA